MFLITLYRHIKDKHGQKTSFIILLAFLLSFITARIYSFFTVVSFFPVLEIRGTHIHHLNFGISFLAIAGFLAFYLANTRFHKKVAVLYGIGLGLTFDEFAMWLHLEDHYWVRASYDAVVIILLILLNAVFFGSFWIRISKRLSFRLSPFYKLIFLGGAKIKKSIIFFVKLCYNNIKVLLYSAMLIFILLVLIKSILFFR